MPPSSGYGAIHGSERQMNANGGGGSGGDDDEAQPLLGSPPKVSYWRRRIMADVRREHADLILILCYVITGLLDSASISAWGSFVSMQTGMFHHSREKRDLGEKKREKAKIRKELIIGLREHGLHRPRPRSTTRVDEEDKVNHVVGLFLRGVHVFQLVSPALFAQAAVGAVRLLSAADGVGHRRRRHRHLRITGGPATYG